MIGFLLNQTYFPGGNPIPPIAVVNPHPNNPEFAVGVAAAPAAMGVAGPAAVVAVDEAAGGVVMLNELEQAAAGAGGVVDENV